MAEKFILLFSVILFAAGCSTVPPKTETAESAAKTAAPAEPDLPVSRAYNEAKRKNSAKLAENYVRALEKSIRTKDFAHLQKILPRKIDQNRAEGIFDAMIKGISKFGTLQKTESIAVLDGTWFQDHLYRFRFTRRTSSRELPEQVFEALYRVRTICPENTPMIIKAEFNFK